MIELKGIENKADLEMLIQTDKIEPVWDNVYIDGTRHKVVRIEDRYHCEGGKYGNNNYWAYPADETIQKHNLKAFDGHVLCWGIRTEDFNRTKHKWDNNQVRSSSRTVITLNGEDLVYVNGSMEYALPKAQAMIIELSEGPINFSEHGWKENLIGRKVFYNGEPAIVDSVLSDLCVMLIPDGFDYFKAPVWISNESDFDVEEWNSHEGRDAKVGMLDSSVYWFRS